MENNKVIKRLKEIEAELLASFNEQQVIEGDDTETNDPNDGAFLEWCKVTVHEDAEEYLSLRDSIER